MNAALPESIVEFESFLQKAGLGLPISHGIEFIRVRDKVLQYGDNAIGVRLVLDRDIWRVEVSDMAMGPDQWYDAALLRICWSGVATMFYRLTTRSISSREIGPILQEVSVQS